MKINNFLSTYNTNDKTWFITPTQANIFKDFNSPIKL